jgi:hypothetical protein
MMYTELKPSEEDRIETGGPGFRQFLSAVGYMTLGLVLIVLAVSTLSPENVVAAAPAADVPCTVCDEAVDPVQYTTLVTAAAARREASVAASAARYSALAEMYASDREVGAASGAGLMIGIPSDPTQLVPLNARAVADREASVAASAARYSALAAMYAADREMDASSEASLALGIPSDPTQLVPLNARAVAREEASVAASAAAFSAYAVRLEALADCYAPANLICSIK